MLFSTAKLLQTVARTLSIFLILFFLGTIPVKFVLHHLMLTAFIDVTSGLHGTKFDGHFFGPRHPYLPSPISLSQLLPVTTLSRTLASFLLSLWPLPLILHIPPNFLWLVASSLNLFCLYSLMLPWVVFADDS